MAFVRGRGAAVRAARFPAGAAASGAAGASLWLVLLVRDRPAELVGLVLVVLVVPG
jgi:hypothetical protein